MYVVVALPQKRPAIHERESSQGWCGLRAGTAENTAATPHTLLGHGDRRCPRRRRSAVYLCRHSQRDNILPIEQTSPIFLPTYVQAVGDTC